MIRKLVTNKYQIRVSNFGVPREDIQTVDMLRASSSFGKLPSFKRECGISVPLVAPDRTADCLEERLKLV